MFYGGGDDLLQAQSWQLIENTPSSSTEDGYISFVHLHLLLLGPNCYVTFP